jgi:hypothetical protein
MILERPHFVAEQTGIPSWYISRTYPKRSPTLDEVGKLYQEKAAVTPRERCKSKLYRDEFNEPVEVAIVREPTAEKVATSIAAAK